MFQVSNFKIFKRKAFYVKSAFISVIHIFIFLVLFTHSASSQEYNYEVFPNPFRGRVEFTYQLYSAAHVSLQIFNESGQEVAKLVDGSLSPGYHTTSWDASGYKSGIYIYRIKIGNRVYSNKLILLE